MRLTIDIKRKIITSFNEITPKLIETILRNLFRENNRHYVRLNIFLVDNPDLFDKIYEQTINYEPCYYTATNYLGRNAIMYACEIYGDENTIIVMLSGNKFNIEQLDHTKQSIFTLACENNMIRVINILLNKPTIDKILW